MKSKSNRLSKVVVTLFVMAGISGAQPLKRYLYLAVPEPFSIETQTGSGYYIYDIDDGYKLVRYVDMPFFRNNLKGLRGFLPNLAKKSVYYTADNTIGRIDLMADTVMWQHTHTLGHDRSSITPDGETIFSPTGFWMDRMSVDSGIILLDGETGEFKRNLFTTDTSWNGGWVHNTLLSSSEKYFYAHGASWISMFRADDFSLYRHIIDVGDNGANPFTADSRDSMAYICHHDHVGFDIVDLTIGKKIHSVSVSDPPTPRRAHGIALTPDETEIWLSDQYSDGNKGQQVITFDNTVFPPTIIDSIPLARTSHGWISFSRDGKHAWTATEEVRDVKTRKVIATLRDENNNPIFSSRFFEAHFKGDELVWVSSQFGLGLKGIDLEPANTSGQLENNIMWLKSGPKGFHIHTEGNHTVKLFTIAGSLLKSESGNGPAHYTFNDIKQRGLFVVHIKTSYQDTKQVIYLYR